MSGDSQEQDWLKHFDERQQQEIKFSSLYAQEFGHGTDGHNAKVLIARMAEVLTDYHIDRVQRLKGKTSEAWAQDAYNRYFISANGENFSGGDMPTWEQLPEDIQRHWIAAIEGVI